jgi:hypothetical protein
MAELQRYNPTGLGLASLPGLPTVEPIALQERIRETQGLSASLDRISQFAFKEAGDEAKRQGLQYGAENPVTKDQIEVALGTGKKPSELFGKRGTIFGEAALQAQSAQLRMELENYARSKMAKTAEEVDAGKLSDIQEIRTQINAPIDGFAKMLAGIDPEESVRFRASMAAAGNTVLKSAYDKVLSVQNAAFRSRIADSVPTTLDFVSRLYETEPDIDAQKGQISVYRNVLLKSLIPTADAGFINSTMAKFEEGVVKLRVDAVSKYVTSTDFSADPLTAVSKLDKNDAGKMTSLWSTMNFEDQAKVRSNLRTVSGQRWDVNEKANKEIEYQDTLAAATAMADYFKTGSAASLRLLDTISRRSPKVISVETVFKLPNERTSVLTTEVANPRGEIVLKTEMLSGKIQTPEAMIARASELGIGMKAVSTSMFPFFIARNNEDERDVDRALRNEAKIVPGQFNISQKSAEAYSGMTLKVERKWTDALEKNKLDPIKNPLPSRISLARDVIKERMTSTKTLQINSLLDGLNKAYSDRTGVTFSETTEPSDIRQRQKALGLQIEEVQRIEKDFQAIDRLRQQRDAE